MAKSFNHKNHWQLQQLKKLQRQSTKEVAPTIPLPSVADPCGSGIIIPNSQEIAEAALKETRTEPIVGLRVWNVEVKNGKPYLRSTYKSDFLWPYKKALEQDICADAGIHAVKPKKDWEYSASQSYFYGFGSSSPQTMEELAEHYKAQVMGEVYLWGRVQEHAYGYLAQFAYPKRLWVSPKMDVLTFMELEHEYGVPCDTHDALDPEKWERPEFNSQRIRFYSYALSSPALAVQKPDNTKSAGV